MIKIIQLMVIALFFVMIIAGCASFRTEIGGSFDSEPKPNFGAEPVNVLFVISHVRQTVGLDAVPKMERKLRVIAGFDDLLMDALREFSNIDQYATFTEYASDVNDPERRALRDSLIAANDYVIKIRIKTEKRFSTFFLKTLLSSITVTFSRCLTLIHTAWKRMFTTVRGNFWQHITGMPNLRNGYRQC